MLGALFASVMAMADPIPPDLDAYVKRPDASFAWSLKTPGLRPLHMRMTSQTWQNVRWTHDIVVTTPEAAELVRTANRQPPTANPKGVAILYITGGEPNKADLNEAQRLADIAKMPVAHLFQIPNQPLFGRNEDDLIAHSFEKFLTTGQSDWVLLFPMVKSAVRAMDALQAATKGSKNPLKRFVVIGASKRGWTSWLVGALKDKRVIGIAPMVFDNLRFKEQLKHQLDSWGKFSEMIADYTDKGLDKVLDTPEGSRLVALVDPWTYRERITIPKLIVNGSNDRYWCVDSLSLYWDGLKGPKYCSIVPNAGHLLGDMKQALNAIGAFARSCAGEFDMPEVGRTFVDKKAGTGLLLTTAPLQRRMEDKFWRTESSTLDFRDAVWRSEYASTSLGLGGPGWIGSAPPKSPHAPHAIFYAGTFRRADLTFIISSPVLVLK